jgi:pseudouridine kinase
MTRLPAVLAGVRLLILNEGELAARLGRQPASEQELADACREVQAQGAQDLVVTRGARGVVYTTADGIACLEPPATAKVDVTGAGDAFAAAVCWSLQRGEALALACRRGLYLSALTLACKETVCPDLTPSTLDDIAAPAPHNTIDQD